MLAPPSGAEGEPVGILVINEYGKDTREFRISEDRIHIGRDPRAEVVLADQGVSRAHARIVRRGADYVLEDLGSRNGTLVNDERIPGNGTRQLQSGDRVQIGRSILRFILRLSQKISTGLRRARRTSGVKATVQEGEAPDRTAMCLFRLEGLRASLLAARPGKGAVRYFLESDRVRIGRAPEADIVLDEATVSGEHAEIVYNKEGFHLVDRDSTMGTFLDGSLVRVAKLAHRSFLRFGKKSALFVIHQEGEEAAEPSFRLRDHLTALHPDRAAAIQTVFQDCRERALDFAEELVLTGALDPEEWWAEASRFEEKSTGSGWLSRLLRR